jgi:hypothetical protein
MQCRDWKGSIEGKPERGPSSEMFSELVGHVTPARKPIHADVGLVNREVGEPAVILVVRGIP